VAASTDNITPIEFGLDIYIAVGSSLGYHEVLSLPRSMIKLHRAWREVVVAVCARLFFQL
jgi:uncharacterized membrane protein